VHVELDGERWRTLPLDVAARVGLTVGLELDRERLRWLRRELLAFAAVDAGARSLARRGRSEQGLRRALARKGVRERERDHAVATLRRAGALDDACLARDRASVLAERGLGDAAIEFELEREGLAAQLRAEAIAELAPEAERAAALVARRGCSGRTARWLASRGFGTDSIEQVVSGIAENGRAELG
jgi:SOS response regulatory protein OraA/RecX